MDAELALALHVLGLLEQVVPELDRAEALRLIEEAIDAITAAQREGATLH